MPNRLALSGMQTTARFIPVLGHRLFVKIWIPENDVHPAPIVLLHDSLGSVALWRDFPEVLCKATNRSVIAYDRWGFGQSDTREDLPSRNFIFEEATDWFPEIKRQLGLDRFVVFGHSVGGAMALMIAAQFPETCEAVISESAQAGIELRTLAGVRTAKSSFQQPGQLERLQKWHGEKADWVLNAWTEVWLSPQFSDYNLQPHLQQVVCPALVIHGSEDEYGSKNFPEIIAAGVGGAATLHLLQGIGHIPHKEAETTVLRLIQTFLDNLPD